MNKTIPGLCSVLNSLEELRLEGLNTKPKVALRALLRGLKDVAMVTK